ncbi:AAA family ATPase [Actinorugispora endophytica]|uniref:MoxR-like ATPase n=1 Tax=Actinorugispora endophytica TaxID=1605990 RepID=A0A4R6V432_9ACTN|nr:MoxR family ATPase [Actinorugispora endophytica]TDQ54994.1 MoxR-like ATPase [Actinorugispora endophytica]
MNTNGDGEEGRARPLSPAEAGDHAAVIDGLTAAIGSTVVGTAETARLALVAMLCQGHILIEDVPGVGKTRLARALAACVGGDHRRVQFTPDLLPSDLTGVNVFNQATREFDFHAGPVFANVVVADEINRAAPKTQAALLEVMEEGLVTVDGVRYVVPDPFLIVATQNPVELDGTYRLPEAQLDRFLMRLSLGYPDSEAEFAIMRSTGLPEPETLNGAADAQDLARVRAAAGRVHVADSVYGYIRAIAESTRGHSRLRLGLSPRATAALAGAARAYAVARGRTYVIPEDVQRLAAPVWAHRLVLTPEALVSGRSELDVLDEVLAGVAAPQPEQAVNR